MINNEKGKRKNQMNSVLQRRCKTLKKVMSVSTFI